MNFVEMPESDEVSVDEAERTSFEMFMDDYTGEWPTPEEYQHCWERYQGTKRPEDDERVSEALQGFLKAIGRPPEMEEYSEILAILRRPSEAPSDDLTPPVEPIVPRIKLS